MRAVERRADGPLTVLFLDRGRDADEVVRALDEDRRRHPGLRREAVGDRAVEIQVRRAIPQDRRGLALDVHLPTWIKGNVGLEAAPEQRREATDLTLAWHKSIKNRRHEIAGNSCPGGRV